VAQIVDEFSVDTGALSLMLRDELERLMQKDEVLLVDVRPALEFDAGHLPGALSIPVEELPGLLEKLSRRRPIVTYCRGAYCLFADEAVAMLRQTRVRCLPAGRRLAGMVG